MGKGSNTVSTAPPKEMMEYYKKIFSRAEKVSKTPYRPYTGELVAPMSKLENQAAAGVTAAGNSYKPYFQQAQQYAKQASQDVTPWSPEAMARYQSPYNEQVTEATMKQLGELQGRQRQDVVGNAISQGAWGGDRSGVAQAEMSRQQGMAAGQTLAGLNQGNYQQAMGAFNQQQGVEAQNRQMEAGLAQQYGQMGVAAQQSALGGIQAQAQLGQSQRAQRQAQDQARMQMWSQKQQYPFTSTQYLANIAMGLGPAMGSQTTYPEPSLFSQIGGLALGGMSMFGGGMFGKKDGGRVTGRAGFADGGAVAGFPARRGYAMGGVPTMIPMQQQQPQSMGIYDPIMVQPFLDPRDDPSIVGAATPGGGPMAMVPLEQPALAPKAPGVGIPTVVVPPIVPTDPKAGATPYEMPATTDRPVDGLGNPMIGAVPLQGGAPSLGNPLVAAPAEMPTAGAPVAPVPYNPLSGGSANTGIPFYNPLSGAEKTGTPAAGVDPTTTATTPAASNAGLFGIGKDKWQGLAALGFGMAAGESPYFGVNAGKGGMAMLQTMQQQREADRLARAQDLQEARDKATQEELHQYHADTIATQRAAQELELQKANMPKWEKIGSDPYTGADKFDWVYPGKSPAGAVAAADEGGDEGSILYDRMPKALQARVDRMLAGDEAIPRNTEGKQMRILMAAAHEKAVADGNPLGFNATIWQDKVKTRQSFKSGADSKTIVAGNNAARAVGILTDAIEALPEAPLVGDNAGFLSGVARDWNKFLKGGGESTEADAYNRFDVISNTVAEEINRFSRGAVGAEADIQRILKSLNTMKSKHELLGGAQELMDVVNGSAEAMQQKWHTGMGPEVEDFPIFTPQSEAARKKIATAYEDSIKRVTRRDTEAKSGEGEKSSPGKFTGPTIPADAPPREGRAGKWFRSKGGQEDDPSNWYEVPPPAAPAAAAPAAAAPAAAVPAAPVVAPAPAEQQFIQTPRGRIPVN